MNLSDIHLRYWELFFEYLKFLEMEIIENTFPSYDYLFPVFGGIIEDNKFDAIEIFGTAFSIGNDYFVTCAHTIENASQHQIIALGFSIGEEIMFMPVNQKEILETNDSGILQCHVERAKPFTWLNHKLSMLSDVISTRMDMIKHTMKFQLGVIKVM